MNIGNRQNTTRPSVNCNAQHHATAPARVGRIHVSLRKAKLATTSEHPSKQASDRSSNKFNAHKKPNAHKASQKREQAETENKKSGSYFSIITRKQENNEQPSKTATAKGAQINSMCARNPMRARLCTSGSKRKRKTPREHPSAS